MEYLKYLDEAQIRKHAEETQALWGNVSASERTEIFLRRIATAGPDVFSMAGLRNEGGTLVASLKRYRFEISVDGTLRKCIGLGSIFTSPAERKKGFAAKLIRKVLEEARDDFGCEFALLYSDIGTKYYESLGFAALPAFEWSVPIGELPDEPGLRARKIAHEDLPRLLSWHQDSTKGSQLVSARNEKTWPLFREMNDVQYDAILSDDRADVAFLSYSLNAEKHYLWLHEFFADPALDEKVWATVRERATHTECTHIKGWMLPACARLEKIEQSPRVKALPMIAALNPRAKLAPSQMQELYLASPDHF